MPPCRVAALLALAALLAWAADEPPPQPPPPGPPGPRVVVLLGRDQDARGYLTYEGQETVELRGLSGKVQSFARSRVLKIVRLVDPVPGQRGVVVLRDGQRREGVIVEDGFDQVVIDVDGIRAKFARETVDSIVLQPTFEERYARYREVARTAAQRLELCQWLVTERRYDLAKTELESLQASDPSREAGQLLRLVQAQLDLGPQAPGAEEGGERIEQPGAGAAGEPPSRIISREEVNVIRVYEIDLNRPPRLAVAAETIQTLLDLYAASPLIPASEVDRRKLFRADPREVVELMFKLRACELYPRIQVLSEPWSLNLFRERVHNTWLVNNCATTACHGGSDAGRFYLHRRHYKDERVRYTNLLILDRLQLDPDWALVNYEDPMMSLLIQYGLPRGESRHPHPDAKGWTPAFDRSSQRMVRDAVSWIQSMMRPRPQYPVDFDPATRGAPAAAPLPAPAPPAPAAPPQDQPASGPTESAPR